MQQLQEQLFKACENNNIITINTILSKTVMGKNILSAAFTVAIFNGNIGAAKMLEKYLKN